MIDRAIHKLWRFSQGTHPLVRELLLNPILLILEMIQFPVLMIAGIAAEFLRHAVRRFMVRNPVGSGHSHGMSAEA